MIPPFFKARLASCDKMGGRAPMGHSQSNVQLVEYGFFALLFQLSIAT